MNDYALADGSNTATAVARRLMDGVFTFEALSTCSVTGLLPRGKGKQAYQDPSSIKPYLCPKGVNAIVCKYRVPSVDYTVKNICLEMNTVRTCSSF